LPTFDERLRDVGDLADGFAVSVGPAERPEMPGRVGAEDAKMPNDLLRERVLVDRDARLRLQGRKWSTSAPRSRFDAATRSSPDDGLPSAHSSSAARR
jgi:hypothetical protein